MRFRGTVHASCVIVQDAMRSRSSARDLGRDALDALEQALHEVGLEAKREIRGARNADLVVSAPGTPQLLLDVKAASIATPEQVRRLSDRSNDELVTVLVADQVPVT